MYSTAGYYIHDSVFVYYTSTVLYHTSGNIASRPISPTRCTEQENGVPEPGLPMRIYLLGVLTEYRQSKNTVVADTRNEHIY